MTNLYSELDRGAEPVGTPRRALTIGAHPDDAEFGAGGTLARWAKEGCELTLLVVTDGSKGSWDPDINPATLSNHRRSEQRRAAGVLGASHVVHLDHVDGELEYSSATRRELTRWIRQLQPDVVLSHDPWRRYMLHPDHRVTGWLAVDAVVAARDHLFFPDLGLAKHRPRALLLWSADEPDHHEDIAETFDIKVEALLCHSSQSQTTMGDATTDDQAREQFQGQLRDWASREAEETSFSLAESFKLITP